MKRITVNRRDLTQAIAYTTHVDAGDKEWTWQVSFDADTADPEARVILSNPNVEPETSYVFVDEEVMAPTQFAGLPDDYRWGEGGTMPPGEANAKAYEAVRIPDDVRQQIERSLLKHVEYNGESYTVRYY